MGSEQGVEMEDQKVQSQERSINNNDQLALRIRTILESFKHYPPEGDIKTPDPGEKPGKQ